MQCNAAAMEYKGCIIAGFFFVHSMESLWFGLVCFFFSIHGSVFLSKSAYADLLLQKRQG
jgi:hypothetical protein